MGRRTFTPEQIINKLREAEVLLSQGGSAGNYVNVVFRNLRRGSVEAVRNVVFC